MDRSKERRFLDGRFLISQREKAGISLADVIARAGVARGNLSALEKGQRTKISVDFVAPLAAAYETSAPDFLLGIYGLTPEDPLILDNAEASRIGRLVLSIDDSDQRETLLSLIESMTEERPSEDGAQEEIPEPAAV